MRTLIRDNKWHHAYANRPVTVQTDYGRYENVVNENILFQYVETREIAGFDEPYVYALDTKENRRFHNIQDEDVSNEPCQCPKGISLRIS